MDDFIMGYLFYLYKKDKNSYILYLFMVYSKSFSLFKYYYNILLLYCNYYINRYQILLFYIISLTGINITIWVIFVLIKYETKIYHV